jgi:cutinase
MTSLKVKYRADISCVTPAHYAQCPNTKLCVSNYNKSTQVAHNAANMISASASSFINSVVLWGDPDDGAPFGTVDPSKVSTDCHLGDDICLHGDLVLLPHLGYCLDANQEASFAVTKSGLK